MRRWWVAVLLLVAACGHPHYTLSAPPPTAAPAERMQAFEQLRAAARGAVTTCSSHGGCTTSEYLVLNDGREIWHPEDLGPVVSSRSDAGESVQRLRDIQANRRVWRDVFLVGLIGGIATIVAGAKLDSDPVIITGELMVAGGLVIGGGGMLVDSFRAAGPKNVILDHYDEGLRQQLNLCVNGTFVFPCEAPGTPPPPDPVLRSLPQR